MELRSKVRDLIGSSRLKPHMTMLRANVTSFLLSLRPRQREFSWKLHWRVHVFTGACEVGRAGFHQLSGFGLCGIRVQVVSDLHCHGDVLDGLFACRLRECLDEVG